MAAARPRRNPNHEDLLLRHARLFVTFPLDGIDLASRDFRVAGAAHVPRAGLRPTLLLYFVAQSAPPA